MTEQEHQTWPSSRGDGALTPSPRETLPRPCAFCGQDTDVADLMDEIHGIFERLVAVAPPPPNFMTNTAEYVEVLAEARRVLGG